MYTLRDSYAYYFVYLTLFIQSFCFWMYFMNFTVVCDYWIRSLVLATKFVVLFINTLKTDFSCLKKKKKVLKVPWNEKLSLPWHSWIIRVLYIEMTYREPQIPLFPPYVNLVNKKDHWKRDESEHNTDGDVTVGITNSYAPNICITNTSPCSMPDASRTIRSYAGIVKKWGQQQKWQIMEINCMFQAVQGWVDVCIQKGTENK